MGTLQIDVLGTSFAIQAKEDTAYLEELLNNYKRMVKLVESGAELKDNLKASILAGIMLCDELYKEKKKNRNYQNTPDLTEVEKMTLHMIESINKVLD